MNKLEGQYMPWIPVAQRSGNLHVLHEETGVPALVVAAGEGDAEGLLMGAHLQKQKI